MQSMPLHLCSLGFLSCLLLGHGGAETALAQPLSMLRDGAFSTTGYAAFLFLFGAALCHCWKLTAAGRRVEGRFALTAAILLAVVAVTPTSHPVHEGLAFLLLGMLYVYFGVILIREQSRFALWHWLAPLWLLCLTGFHSFGLWQKTMIVYFVVASNVEALLAAVVNARKRQGARRRKVWLLEEGRAWARTKTMCTGSYSHEGVR